LSFYDNLKYLCDARGIKITPFVKECGGAPGSISAWKNGSFPNSEFVVEAAMRLNASCDELLLGPDAKKEPPLCSEEAAALGARYDALDDDGKAVVRCAIVNEERRLSETNKKDTPGSSGAKAI